MIFTLNAYFTLFSRKTLKRSNAHRTGLVEEEQDDFVEKELLKQKEKKTKQDLTSHLVFYLVFY